VAWGDGGNSGQTGGGGGGLSAVESEPAWQTSVVPAAIDPVAARALPDVSMDSGSAQEYDVFTSTLSGSSVSAAAVGWLGDAGTSAASPIWAGLIAIANQGRVLAGGMPLTGNTQTLPALYALPSADYHDILYGNNGDPAGPGYDLATGLGTPVANLLVPDLAGYQIASKMAIAVQPPSTVLVGNTFGLGVGVADRLGNPVNGGSVTVALGNHPSGATLGGTLTEAVINGRATFSDLTLSQPGTGYTLIVSVGGIAGSLTTSPVTAVAGGNATSIVVTSSPIAPVLGQTVALKAAVLIVGSGTGTPTGAVVFKAGSSTLGTASLQDGVATLSTTPPLAGIETISVAYGGDASDQSSRTQFTLTVGPATPTIMWASPANISVGTPLGAAQLDAVATFNGAVVAGVIAYSPGAGTVLSAGNGQKLTVTFTPYDTNDFKATASAVLINVLPQSAAPVATIIGEQPVFRRQLKNGKPVGKLVLTGFTLEFSTPLVGAAVANAHNYQLEVLTAKRVKKQIQKVLQPVKNFTVSYSSASDSVTLKLTSTQSFTLGGQLRVFSGVTTGSGAVLGGSTVFTIAPRGIAIGP
jgi:hypothetical protein